MLRPACTALGLAVLASCAAPPPPPVPPTALTLDLQAGPDINPGPGGVPAPVVVRIYQLGGSSAFENAEFFQLLDADKATLGMDLDARADIILSPGGHKTVRLSPGPTVTAIGVLAAVRDPSRARWTATARVAPHRTTLVSVSVTANGLALGSRAAPAPASPPGP